MLRFALIRVASEIASNLLRPAKVNGRLVHSKKTQSQGFFEAAPQALLRNQATIEKQLFLINLRLQARQDEVKAEIAKEVEAFCA